MKIGWATVDWSQTVSDETGIPAIGGAGHYRCGLPAKYLQTEGIDAVLGLLILHNDTGAFGVQTWDAEPHWDLDVIVLQRYMHVGLAAEIRSARAAGQVIVNDVDDHFDALDKRNQAFGVVRGNPIANATGYRETILAGDAVLVSTPVLRDYYEALGQKAVLLENGVELSAFTQRTHVGTPRLGWVGSTPWRSGDVETARAWLPDFLSRYPDVTFRHDGHVPGFPLFATQAGLNPNQVTLGPMRPPSEIPRLFDEMDVGLVLLNDIPFNHAKSWIKGLEYVAAGLPFVAQNLPEYVRLHQDYGIGRTAGGRSAWRRALSGFLDPAARQEAADANLAALGSSGLIWGAGGGRPHAWATALRELL